MKSGGIRCRICPKLSVLFFVLYLCSGREVCSQEVVSPKESSEIVSSFKTTYPALALTFDDGPHPVHTPRLLDILAHYGVRATFFVVGSNVVKYPEIAQRIVAEGHQLGNHTFNHPDLTKVKKKNFDPEVEKTSQAIESYTGVVPLWFRPPYGALNERVIQRLKKDYPMTIALWSVDPEDWKKPGSDVIAQRIISAAKPGAIILAHDIHGQTIDAMPVVIQNLKAAGYRFGTLSQLKALPDVSFSTTAGGQEQYGESVGINQRALNVEAFGGVDQRTVGIGPNGQEPPRVLRAIAVGAPVVNARSVAEEKGVAVLPPSP